MKTRRTLAALLVSTLMLAPAMGMTKTIAEKPMNLGLELGLPLIAGIQAGYMVVPQLGASVGYSKFGLVNCISLEGRVNLKPDNFRPYLLGGYDIYSVKDDTAKASFNFMHLGLGLEYAWDSGFGIGIELVYWKWMSVSYEDENNKASTSMVDEDASLFLPNLQLRAYF